MQPSDSPLQRVPHSRAGFASILLFQLVVVCFFVLIIVAQAELAPGWLGEGRAAMHTGLRWAFMITIPLAVVGIALGLVGSMQMRRRKLLGGLGTLLNGLHLLLGLLVLSYM